MQRNSLDPSFRPVAFNAGDFVGVGTLTWTVQQADVVAHQVALSGNVCFLTLNLDSTTTGGVADASLRYVIPFGIVAAVTQRLPIICQPHGAAVQLGNAIVTAGSGNIDFQTVPLVNWVVGANDTDIRAQLVFEFAG